jgi:hypothetical protein
MLGWQRSLTARYWMLIISYPPVRTKIVNCFLKFDSVGLL